MNKTCGNKMYNAYPSRYAPIHGNVGNNKTTILKNIVFTSANELVENIKSKKVSIVEVATAFLEQIKKHNSKVNAICDLRNEEEILTEARQKDEDIRLRKKLGILHGLPLTIKDSFFVKGLKKFKRRPFPKKNILLKKMPN